MSAVPRSLRDAGGQRLALVLAGLLLVTAGCTAAQTTPSGTTSSASSRAESSLAPTPSAQATACDEEPVTSSPGLVSGSFADVVTTDLVMRTAPRISEDSDITGELNQPARVYISAGPVRANGYEWWAVIPEGGNSESARWVAAAGKDGEVWLAPAPRDEGTWTILSRFDAMDVQREPYFAAVGPDRRVYLFGGRIGVIDPSPVASWVTFDPATCEWAQFDGMPFAPDGARAVTATDGRMYVIAPHWDPEGEDPPTSDFAAFDPATGAWEELATVPRTIGYGSGLAADTQGRIWTFGWDGVSSYDIDNANWTALEPLADIGNVDYASLMVDGRIAVLSAGAGGLHVFDPSAGGLATIGAPRVARYNATVAEIGPDRFVVAGGYLAGGCIVADPPPEDIPASPHYGLYDVVDTTTGAWQSLAPLELGFESNPLVIDGDLYAIGLDAEYDSSGSDPVLVKAELVVARYTPAEASGGSAADPGAGGCGG
ncbi:MAG TPA: kelch repeat-containing protein [Candidatus Limnocylindria bacterium]